MSIAIIIIMLGACALVVWALHGIFTEDEDSERALKQALGEEAE